MKAVDWDAAEISTETKVNAMAHHDGFVEYMSGATGTLEQSVHNTWMKSAKFQGAFQPVALAAD